MRYQISWTKKQRKSAKEKGRGLIGLAFEGPEGDRMEMLGHASPELIEEVRALLAKYMAYAGMVLALAFLTACGVPALASFDGGGTADATYPDGATPLDAGLDGSDAADAAPTPDASLDGDVDAGTDLGVDFSSDAGVTDAATACADAWPLRSGAIATYGCALPPDNVCNSSTTVPTADVVACEAALRAASSCESIDVPACWYVRPAGVLDASADGGDCIFGTPSAFCLDPTHCREHRGAGFVCLPCCP